MALPSIFKDNRHTAIEITWLRQNGVPVDLTGATITGTKRNKSTSVNSTITGSFTIMNTTQGIFRWSHSAADVATVGTYQVQFRATYGSGDFEDSIAEDWEVLAQL